MNKFVEVQGLIPEGSATLQGTGVLVRDSADRLILEIGKFLKAKRRRSRDLYIYLQAYERGAETMRPLVAFVTFYRGQTKAFETPPLGVTGGMDAKSKAVPMGFSLALSKLPPGKYDCQVTVLDPSGGKGAFWQAPILLVQ